MKRVKSKTYNRRIKSSVFGHFCKSFALLLICSRYEVSLWFAFSSLIDDRSLQDEVYLAPYVRL